MLKSTAYAEKLSEMGKSSLAEYIVHRKAVLDILEGNLKYQDSDGNSYAYEESIHQLVFPMQNTSDDIDYTSHNLWLIDEKLSYPDENDASNEVQNYIKELTEIVENYI